MSVRVSFTVITFLTPGAGTSRGGWFLLMPAPFLASDATFRWRGTIRPLLADRGLQIRRLFYIVVRDNGLHAAVMLWIISAQIMAGRPVRCNMMLRFLMSGTRAVQTLWPSSWHGELGRGRR